MAATSRCSASVGAATDRPFRVYAEVEHWNAATEVVGAIERRAPTGTILWQYVPHMYGRGGVNPGLPRVWREWRRRGRRQVALVHEMAAPFSWWPHRTLYALAHRWMWRALRENVDAMGVSTGRWLERLSASETKPATGSDHSSPSSSTLPPRSKAASPRLFLAPSPANLAVVPVTPDHRVRWCARQGPTGATRRLGFFGAPGSGKQFDWALAAWRRVRRDDARTALVVVGDPPTVELTAEERPWFRALGYLPDAEASESLQTLDLLLLPFSDGVSERRSSFMAGLAHGVSVATTFGVATSAALRGAGICLGHAVEAGGAEGYAAAVAKWVRTGAAGPALGERGRAFYRDSWDWPRLAERILPFL